MCNLLKNFAVEKNVRALSFSSIHELRAGDHSTSSGLRMETTSSKFMEHPRVDDTVRYVRYQLNIRESIKKMRQ